MVEYPGTLVELTVIGCAEAAVAPTVLSIAPVTIAPMIPTVRTFFMVVAQSFYGVIAAEPPFQISC
ncbi:hypothetical protein [Curtobacterium sp. VKM Ac-1395]|uniref:hypothetical protein n=1 Tax=Curtobacterium sp. VKM Ac-1395 TaxID=2783815 RepID=UPI00188CC968|nr:hypothetical protein [Curtobacterium sp. VKM Ac-1395]MBF4591766.1 hypothetical protein [Curtobacterium sp. VKM Ac-1395]